MMTSKPEETSPEVKKVPFPLTQDEMQKWAQRQGMAYLAGMEKVKSPQTLRLSWKEDRMVWLGGFITGVMTALPIGYELDAKIADKLKAIPEAEKKDDIK